MARAIELAENGKGHVSPNPMVGCLIVHQGNIIGEGFHAKAGEAHAEVNAIQAVKDPSLLSASTLYVTLEPCSHHGKTPPCSDLILHQRIPKVVIGSKDPNPLVGGKGIGKLRDKGVEVHTGILQQECEKLNRRFFTFHEKKRPWVVLKWAQTHDGFMDRIREAHEKPLKITGKEASTYVHKWRSEEDAILIGRETLRTDRPQLTARHWKGNNPIRVVLGTLSEDYLLAWQEDGIPSLNLAKKQKVDFPNHLKYIAVDPWDIQQVLLSLYKENIQSVMVEGGPRVLQSFLDQGMWDEARVFSNNKKISTGVDAPTWRGLPKSTTQMGADQLDWYWND